METEASTQRSHWDSLRTSIQELRAAVGNPSYGEIADRIAAARRASGLDEHAARIARSTVYDAFTLGRARINLPLVREIAAVLGAADEQVDAWVAACHDTSAVRPGQPEQSAADHDSAPAGWLPVAVLLLGCLGLNMLGRMVVDFLELPVYLDMVGTAVAAIALGPWRGAAVGGATNVLAALTSGWVSIPFAVVNIAGALVWGYGVRRFGWGRTLPRFFALNLVVAGVCSLIAVPILVIVFGGSVGAGQDSITQTFMDLGNGLLAAVGFSNILTSTADKLISGFVALVVVSSLPAGLRVGTRLVGGAI